MAGLSVHVPISELNPALDAQSSKSVKALVTLTWPYSSATGSVAFLLAEPDFRLRRSKGQVRVQFCGSSATRIARCGIASGDEVIVCLDGVEWLRDVTTPATPGRGVDFELKFTERLLLQFTPEGSETQELIDIDHPPAKLEEAVVPETRATPESSITAGSKNASDLVLKNVDEWSSPAFIKRARTSYGSLFDTGYDPFAEEDGSIAGKGRKRSRLSSTWRYVSRSPSPEPDEESVHATSPTPAPTMADGGSQTIESDVRDTAETLAQFSRQASGIMRNVEVSVFGNYDQQHDARLTDIRTAELSPATHTPIPTDTTDVTQQIYTHEEPPPAPSSPHLKPIPSDALPLVSPLQASTPNPFTQNSDRMGHTVHTIGDISTISRNQELLPHDVEDGHVELIQTGHVHSEGEHIPEFTAFHGHAMTMTEVEHQGFEGQLLPSSQFGQWESVNAHPGLSSPSRDEPPAEHFATDRAGEDDNESHRFEEENLPHGFSIPPPEATYHQYPPLDHDLQRQPIDSPWALGHGAVSYPDLPDYQQDVGRIVSNVLPSSPFGVFQAKDAQTAVGLRESEVGIEDRYPSEESGDDNVSEGSVEALAEEEEVVENDEISEQDEALDRRSYLEDEMPVDDELVSEEYSEENEDYNRYDEEDFSDEDRDEEDQYDMDVDQPQHRFAVQREPVVIDLLSSDDEDAEEMPTTSPKRVKSPKKEAEPEVTRESKQDEDESDAEMDDYQELGSRGNIPYAQRSELPTNVMRDHSRESLDEEEEQTSADKVGRHIEADDYMDGVVEDTDDQDKLQVEDNEHVDLVRPSDASNDDENNQQTAIHPDEIPTSPAQSPAKPEVTQVTEALVEEPAPKERPSLLARMFNLDGANDEPTTISSFHISPKKVTATRVTSNSAPSTQGTAIDQSLVQGNIQLPTPDATQSSVLRDFQEDSSLVSDPPHPIESSQQPTAEQPTDTAVENNDEPLPKAEKEQVVKSTEEEEVGLAETSKKISEGEIEDGTKKGQAQQVEEIEEQNSIETHEALNDHVEAAAENHVEDSQESTRVSPRRSRRIGRLSGTAAQIAEIMRPSTSDDSSTETKLSDEQTSPAILDRQASEDGLDPSIQMAMSVSKPSLKPQHDLRPTSMVDLKLSLSRSLRTDLGQFTALKVLRFHLNQKLDVLAIVTSTPAEPQRTKGGPRHYQITFNITDSSVAPSGVTEVQVYRPYIEALPAVREGDGILLRNFQVIAIKNRGFALRSELNEASSWAVYRDDLAEPEIRGPPVEHGPAERKHIAAMKEWFDNLDATSVGKLQRANADKGSGVGKGIGKAA